MARLVPVLRDACPEDRVALVDLWSASARDGEATTPPPSEEAGQALATIAASPDERIVVALVDDTLAAAIHLRRGRISPLHTDLAVHTSHLLVRPEFRRHGIARALLDVAVSWAEDKDVDHVTAVTTNSSRETQRFLTRLGLGTVATVRATTTATLRRRLAPEPIRPGQGRLGQVLAQRRTAQRRRPETAAGQE